MHFFSPYPSHLSPPLSPLPSVEPLKNIRTFHIQLCLVNIQTICLPRPIRTQHIDTRRTYSITDILTGTCKGADLWLILFGCLSVEVLEHDVRDSEWRRELQAEREVGLTVALIHFDGVVHVVDDHGVVCDVLDHSSTAASLQIAGESRGCVGPDFDAGSVLCKLLASYDGEP